MKKALKKKTPKKKAPPKRAPLKSASIKVNPKHPVIHHEQDSRDNCGRACAQMIIASMLHKKKSKKAGATVAIIDQTLISQLEGGPPDPGPNKAGWFTTPVDLVTALNHVNNGLDPSLHQWRVASVSPSRQHELLAEIALSMKVYGTPAAILTTVQDHWRVVVGVDIGLTSTGLRLDDPDSLVSSHGGGNHRYFDACQHKAVVVGNKIVHDLVRPDVFAFGGLNLTIEPIPGIRNSSGHDGKAVAVVFGDARAAAPQEFAELVQDFKGRCGPKRGDPIPLDEVLRRGKGRWMDRLRSLVGDLEDARLVQVADGLQVVGQPRLVRRLPDVSAQGDGAIPDAYVIVGAFAADAGAVAVFDNCSEGLLLAARWVADRRDLAFLEKRPDQQLFWAPTRHTRSPTVPFTIREKGKQRIATRLTDDFEFDPLQPANDLSLRRVPRRR